MEKKALNPTSWLLGFGINHGIEVRGGERAVYLAGQTATNADGAPQHAGDVVAQVRLAWSNIRDALALADMDPTNIVRLNMYTTDVPAFMAAAAEITAIWAGDDCQPVGTLLGVTALFHPDIMVELEVTAVA